MKDKILFVSDVAKIFGWDLGRTLRWMRATGCLLEFPGKQRYRFYTTPERLRMVSPDLYSEILLEGEDESLSR